MSTRNRVLDRKVTLYIPAKRANPSYRRRLIEAAGGLTERTVYGYWRSPEGELVSEAVHEVVIHYDSNTAWILEPVVTNIVEDLLVEGEVEVLVDWGTKAVMYS